MMALGGQGIRHQQLGSSSPSPPNSPDRILPPVRSGGGGGGQQQSSRDGHAERGQPLRPPPPPPFTGGASAGGASAAAGLITPHPPAPRDADSPPPNASPLAPAGAMAADSMDFDEPQSAMLDEHRLGGAGQADWLRWPLLVGTGCGTGVVAFLIRLAVEFLSKTRWLMVDELMAGDKDAPPNTPPPIAAPLAVFAAANALFAAVAAGFVVAEPMAAGSGIPEVKCVLNGVRMPRLLTARTVVAKCLGIVCSVCSCLPLGKEGPMVHAGSGVGALCSGACCLLPGVGPLRGRTDVLQRDFVSAGAAAGVAAAFGAPVGGVLFAVEEGCSFWSVRLAGQVFLAASCSVLTINSLSEMRDPTAPASGLTNFGELRQPYDLWELPFVALLGPAGGLLGASFNALNARLAVWRQRNVPRGNPSRRVAEVVCVSVLVSTVLFVLAARAYNCEPISKLDYTHEDDNARWNRGEAHLIVKHGCSNETYNDMATYFLNNMETSVGFLFHGEDKEDMGTLAIHLVPYFFLFVLTYGIGVPAGVFLPCLVVGANLGRLYGELLNSYVSGTTFAGAYACFGAAAFLAGVTRMTVSLSVIVMESTNNATYIVPLMLVTFLAKAVADCFNDGLYDIHIHLQGVPFLSMHDESPVLSRKNSRGGRPAAAASDVMNPHPATLPLSLPPQDLAERLRARPTHNAWLVCGDDGRLRGLALRRDLLALLGERAFGDERLAMRQLLRWREDDAVADPPAGETRPADIAWYMDRAPFIVWPATPLPRVHRALRELGLRHIVVQDPDTARPLGVITRKNILSAPSLFGCIGLGARTPHSPGAYPSSESPTSSMQRPLSSDAPIEPTRDLLADPQRHPAAQRTQQQSIRV